MLGSIFLQTKGLENFHILGLAPRPTIVLRVHQLGTYRKFITPLSDASGKHSAYAKLLTQFLHVIHLPALVTSDRGKGSDFQIRQLREVANNALGDPICKVFGIRQSANDSE